MVSASAGWAGNIGKIMGEEMTVED
jgi:hypothetical protein